MVQKKSSHVLFAAISGLITAYGAAYFIARLTHRLVYYGSFVARPHAMHGVGIGGFTIWEVVFMPLAAIEPAIRSLLPC